MIYVVYEIQGPGAAYIGKTNNLAKRWNQHKSDVSTGRAKCRYLHAAMKRHGVECFSIQPLLTCKNEIDANRAEVDIIRARKEAGEKLYNLTVGGEGVSGLKPTAEARQKMSIAASRPARRAYSPEIGKKLSALFKGKKLSEVAHQKVVDAAKRRRLTEETRRKMSESAKRRANTPEGLLRLSLAREEAQRLRRQKP